MTEAVAGLVAVAREAGAAGLVVATSGNASVRLEGGSFAISASGTRLAALEAGDVLTLSYARDRPIDGPRRPSRETPMHRAIYRASDAVGAVLHVQSPAATVLACREGPLPDLAFIPEVPVYLSSIAEVPYLAPGTEALSRAVAAIVAADPTVAAVQLRGHGQVVLGATPGEALDRARFLEFACHLVLLAEGGPPLRRYLRDERRVLESY